MKLINFFAFFMLISGPASEVQARRLSLPVNPKGSLSLPLNLSPRPRVLMPVNPILLSVMPKPGPIVLTPEFVREEVNRIRSHALAAFGGKIRARILIDGVEGQIMKPGQAFKMTLLLTDEDGRPIPKDSIEINHEKPAHVILAKSDLSLFKTRHFHPYLVEDGRLEITLNEPNNDPDNQGASDAVTEAGDYSIFLEIKLKGQPVALLAFDAAAGKGQEARLVADPVREGKIEKYFTKDGQLTDQRSGHYKVTLTSEKTAGMLQLNAKIQERMAHGDHVMWVDVTDLEDWLGMKGHGPLIGQKGRRAKDKVFRHAHAGGHDGGHGGGGHGGGHGGGGLGDLIFMLHGEEVPPSGLYGFWIQIKRKIVLTFPFAIEI